jgi:hypothetical protein
MRTDDGAQKWMTPVIAVLLDPQLLPQPEDHESLQVLAAVMVQIAAHDLERFNEQILPALLGDSRVSNGDSRVSAVAANDASVLLATACVRVIAEASSGFAEHARKTVLHARSAGAFKRTLHKTRVRYVQTVARIIRDVERRLQADSGAGSRSGAAVQRLGDSWPEYASLDAVGGPQYHVGYTGQLDGADWSRIDESLRPPGGAIHRNDPGVAMDPRKAHQVVASACLNTAAHCIEGALEDATVRIDPEFNRWTHSPARCGRWCATRLARGVPQVCLTSTFSLATHFLIKI